MTDLPDDTRCEICGQLTHWLDAIEAAKDSEYAVLCEDCAAALP